MPTLTENVDTLPEAQASALRAAYEKIENLQQAIARVALASFRAFSYSLQFSDKSLNSLSAPVEAPR